MTDEQFKAISKRLDSLETTLEMCFQGEDDNGDVIGVVDVLLGIQGRLGYIGKSLDVLTAEVAGVGKDIRGK